MVDAQPTRARAVSRVLGRIAERIDRRVGWSRLRPTLLGLAVLAGSRERLRAENLYGSGPHPGELPPEPENPHVRTIDGSWNDLADPGAGAVGCRFGRNFPPAYTFPESAERLLDPNPRTVSRTLLTRDTFRPASTLNLLAAAWIQFEVHDWLSHAADDERPHEVPLDANDPWPANPMTIPRTGALPGEPPTYTTEQSHWWDASQIYGSTAEFADSIRSKDRGMIAVDEHGLPPVDIEQLALRDDTAANFWVGLALLHSLFTREHNAICLRLSRRYPDLTDQQLYDTARLVNAALIAKIHTVDWTPALIAHPTTVAAMRANWFGVLGEEFRNRFGRIGDSEILSGIPGAPIDDSGVPYSLTEEFVAVYRMHPLIPDTLTLRALADDRAGRELDFPELGVAHVRERLTETPMADLLYSFGRANPGALTLHNYPRHLQDLRRPGYPPLDLATVDILRVRERGVPRYNEFRRQLRLAPATSFEELTDDPAWARELREVYGEVENVDLMVGLYAETKPEGFGFSDTAFRIFVLMASRRLAADRFFTTDFRPEVYTEAGMAWIRENDMRSVLLRHFPTLAPALDGVANPFAPWRSTADSQERNTDR
ncbi:peroxidase family protein [Nocardia sp. NPDC050697]|uniref:peroxidase family protein n=1 Tax=Nocardia sp. NPDC050697 TaxID=3155158 RepID=UPI0033D69C35